MGQMPDFAYDLMLMIGSGLLVPVVCHGMVALPSEVTWGSCAQIHHLMQTLQPVWDSINHISQGPPSQMGSADERGVRGLCARKISWRLGLAFFCFSLLLETWV